MSECLNITCRNLDPHNHGDDCDDFCQTCNTPLSQGPPLDEGWQYIDFPDINPTQSKEI